MEINQCINEIDSSILVTEDALAKQKMISEKMNTYRNLRDTIRPADRMVYLLEIESIIEDVDKSLLNAIIHCRALSDVIKNDLNVTN